MKPSNAEVQQITEENLVYLDSRFGKIRIDLNKTIYFPNGLLGVVETKSFCLANFPNSKFESFKILQAKEYNDLAFVLLPVDNSATSKYSNLIPQGEIEAACKELQVASKDMVFMLITTIEREAEGKAARITVNTKAPIIINSKTGNAIQHVFTSDKFDIKHQISL